MADEKERTDFDKEKRSIYETIRDLQLQGERLKEANNRLERDYHSLYKLTNEYHEAISRKLEQSTNSTDRMVKLLLGGDLENPRDTPIFTLTTDNAKAIEAIDKSWRDAFGAVQDDIKWARRTFIMSLVTFFTSVILLILGKTK